MATSDATFRIYENIGFQATDTVAKQHGTFRTYENIAYYLDPSQSRSTAVTSYLSMGIEPIFHSGITAAISYENIGVAPGTVLSIVRQPRGWGTLPTGPQTIKLPLESSRGTATSYENII